ncbi:hypothetical protein BGZ65_002281, partial [Modicella reniformis]
MAAIHSISSPQNPPQTFLDKKPPLMPRQSTSDVLSFTHIIANRLAPGQNVWDFFSPPPSDNSSESGDAVCATTTTHANYSMTGVRGATNASNGLPPLSPASSVRSTSPGHSPQSSMSMLFKVSSTSPAFSASRNNSPRHSLVLDPIQGQECTSSNNSSKTDLSLPSSSPLSPLSSNNNNTPAAVSPLAMALANATSASIITPTETETPKHHKRRSFAQSFRNSIISLSQLLSPTSSRGSFSSTNSSSTGPPHYNVLVLGSDSAPLASTLYKMSSLLPGTTKIRHYQEISGFFVAHFRSNESLSNDDKSSLTAGAITGASRTSHEALRLGRYAADEVK